ncbi:hypothetical protein [Bradyrhizobium sp. AT1]|uniref:hypothetical protein n=1 Tax=Bradyrhizobium sp. AT1 TaxID=574934 RepID=UPI000A4B6DEB|nr:hypothetical protein [Bradyrhizobium sp. AT1]
MISVPTWSSLRAIGNSPAAKASILIPFLGYLILFNKRLVEALAFRCIDYPCQEQILFPNLYFLYFGLTIFGLGSFLYQVQCDPRIKRFANVEDYVLSVRDITTNLELEHHQHKIDSLMGESLATNDFLGAQLTDPDLAPSIKLDILTRHYRALDSSKKVGRLLVAAAYFSGLGLLAIPSIATLIQITRSLVGSWIG